MLCLSRGLDVAWSLYEINLYLFLEILDSRDRKLENIPLSYQKISTNPCHGKFIVSMNDKLTEIMQQLYAIKPWIGHGASLVQ